MCSTHCGAAEGQDYVTIADREAEIIVFQQVHKAGLGPKFYG